ncbi:Cocaine esterase [Petrimonas mucosa]|uniref:Cocaine esterase n=1 Tax=Petrimonas mucosa TaxID=1642646 RepID=A0A1G4G3T2_9BACT|nr:Cocaine esterase [Petrimonas mucosa]
MTRKFLFPLLLSLFGSVCAQDNIHYLLLTDSVETSSGIKLATDIYLPDHESIYPTLLVRTPYKKENVKSGAIGFVKKGYAVVVQDCRGKFGSEGEFYAFNNEREDGLKTVEWIKKQSWSNGKVAGYGGSYVGFTQWAISDQLDAVCAEMTGADVYDLIYPQGLFSLATAFNWGLTVDAKTTNPISPEQIQESYWYLPLSVADDSTYKENRFINDWLLHEKRDKYWQSVNHRGIAKGPVFSIAGWYDIFLLTQLEDFIIHDKKNPHPDNKMIITPWGHGPQALKNEYGGTDKTGNRGLLLEQFLDKVLSGKGEIKLEAPFTNHKYNFFIMERNEYVGSETWPPKGVKKTDYFLGERSITKTVPDNSAKLSFVYNPEDPYPSLGGTFIGMDVGPAVQNKNIERADQWVFESEVLDSTLTLLGSISASLYVSSTVVNTDFIIMVQDLFPNDTIVNIQEGGREVSLEPGKISKIEIESWPTGYQLNRGHKLRIVITSSWFPRYNRNLNTDEPTYLARDSKKAVQTIYLGPGHPSKITLPVFIPDR